MKIWSFLTATALATAAGASAVAAPSTQLFASDVPIHVTIRGPMTNPPTRLPTPIPVSRKPYAPRYPKEVSL